jgi:hypothetical protein
MTIEFWSNDPTVLLNKENIFELWPTTNMCYEQKLNAISRLVILITLLGYFMTMSLRVLVIGVLTLSIIFILFKLRKQKVTKDMLHEGFSSAPLVTDNSASYINPVTLDAILKTEFKEGNKKNPFSNVLLTQIVDDPERKSAPPSFNVDVDESITQNVKKAVQLMNPGIKNTNKQLFGDLYQDFELTQSNRQFFSTANTRVENDQSAYAQFLYNDLKYSGKESTPEGALTRIKDNYRYTLY